MSVRLLFALLALLCWACEGLAEVNEAQGTEPIEIAGIAIAERVPQGVRFEIDAPGNGVAWIQLTAGRKDARPQRRRFPVVAGENAVVVPWGFAGATSWNVEVITREYGNAGRVGTLGRGEEQFTNPQALTLGTGGRLYVADTGNDRVEVLSDRHTYLFEFGGFAADSARVQQGETQRFDEPFDLVQSINRDVYVVDRNNARVVRIDRDGRFLSAFGESARLKLPRGIASNRRGEIIVADTGNDRLVVFDRDGREQRTFGTFGWGPRQFKTPYDVAVDDENGMIVADTYNDRVQIFDNFGKLVSILKGEFARPLAVRADSDGFVWIVDGRAKQVLRYARDNRVIERFAAPRLPLEEPADVAITPEGHVYIVDRAASALWRVECRTTTSSAHGILER